jgi:hypothetical protein
MAHNKTLCTIALAVLAATGCAVEADDPPLTPREKLARSTVLPVQQDARLELSARVGGDADPTLVQVRIDDGVLALAADENGSLVLVALDVEVEDIVLGEAGGPIEGIHLTDLRGTLAEPVALDTTWLDADREALGAAPVSLLLDWSIQPEVGNALPLSTERIDDIQLDVRVFERAYDELAVEVTADHPGVFWDWSEHIVLSDLSLAANAVEL